MLDNEPVGGERTGSEPAAETADTSTTPPTRRARVTRRRTAATPAENGAGTSQQVTGEAAGTAPAGDTAGTASAASGPASAAPEPAAEKPVKATRRRRKIVPSEAPAEVAAAPTDARAAPATEAGGAAVASGGEESVVEPAPAAKVTRTRRRKVAAAEPVTEAVSPAGAESGPSATAPTSQGVSSSPEAPSSPAAPAGAEVAEEQPEQPRTRRRRASPPTVLFMAPDPSAVSTFASRPEPTAEPVIGPLDDTETGEVIRRRKRGRRTQETAEPVAEPVEEAAPAVAEEAEESDESDEDFEGNGRRRRRGRRGRGRGKGSADEADEAEEAEEAAQADEGDTGEGDEGDESDEPLTRRRRRRRRKGANDDGVAAEDGVPTVVRIRDPRRVADEVQGVSGSTRLEAKRQRRRDGRDQRRTRPPILSESEFLARREAVDRVMVVRQRGDRTQIAVLEDGVLVEHYVTRASAGTMAGNVYLGKVQNVLPSMEAAFVDVGRGRNAVLYAGEVNWDATGLEGRARSIEQALKSGDSVLVQVTKDPIGHKGARLTSHVALSGRHLVYVPNGNASGISRKLPDNERKRLRDILKKMVPDGAGVIVRTAAEGASEDDLARDVKRLQAQWEDIQAKGTAGGAPVLLYEEPDLVIRVVRDLFNEDFRELVVQGDDAYAEVEAYLSHVSPDLVSRLRRHVSMVDVFAERRIDEQILKGLDRKVFLPSGGHLVIDRTEAMTVVDVNTGKYTGAGGNLEETVTRNNLEAAEEIVRQLRLRDLGGIVVIDFIDMVLESNRELVLRRLTECLGRDRTKHQVTEITSLGLVQMTRKRIGAGLLEAFSETCEHCKGRGLIIYPEPVPDKPRQGTADKVKAMASAVPGGGSGSSGAGSGNGGSTGTTKAERRRARKATVEPEPSDETAEPMLAAAVDASLAEDLAVPVDEIEDDDTMGYDLSRYAEPADEMIPIDDDEDDIALDEDARAAANGVAAGAFETGAVQPVGVGAAADPVGDDPVENDQTGADADQADVDDLDEDDERTGLVPSGRRRARRSGTRRRTRP